MMSATMSTILMTMLVHYFSNEKKNYFSNENKNIIFRMKTKILVSLVTQVRQKQLALCS
jgi:hypothetical protein